MLLMLKNTFQHIPGIGAETEKRIWASGITDWDCLSSPDHFPLPEKRVEMLARHLPESDRQYQAGNPAYFGTMLPAHLHWRFFPEFRETTAYLDIETDGLDPYGGIITTIALYDGQSVSWYVNGDNLEAFVDDIQKYKVIVTYNGKVFDVPFICRYFGITLPQTHIDLRYVLGSLGYKGGLKKCEIALGIDRGDLQGIDGFFAPLLWEEYVRRHNPKALDTLLAYNIEDVVNLEQLMVMAYNKKIAETPFALIHRLPPPVMPPIPFAADLPTVEKIKRRAFASYGY